MREIRIMNRSGSGSEGDMVFIIMNKKERMEQI